MLETLSVHARCGTEIRRYENRGILVSAECHFLSALVIPTRASNLPPILTPAMLTERFHIPRSSIRISGKKNGSDLERPLANRGEQQ